MLSGITVGRRRISVAVVFMLGVLFMAAGCGKAEFEYVANTDDKTYFKVPASWTEVDASPIDDYYFGDPDSALAQTFKRLRWSVAYDAANTPTVLHLTTMYPTVQPVVFSMILHLPAEPPELRGQVSLEYLRDLNTNFLVTRNARAQADQAGQGLPGFELLLDEVLTPSEGVHGVRVVYNYQLATAVHTFDLTALANNDSSVIYLLIIRCTAQCYRDRAAELDGIATSFTVGNKA